MTKPFCSLLKWHHLKFARWHIVSEKIKSVTKQHWHSSHFQRVKRVRCLPAVNVYKGYCNILRPFVSKYAFGVEWSSRFSFYDNNGLQSMWCFKIFVLVIFDIFRAFSILKLLFVCMRFITTTLSNILIFISIFYFWLFSSHWLHRWSHLLFRNGNIVLLSSTPWTLQNNLQNSCTSSTFPPWSAWATSATSSLCWCCDAPDLR